jgi:ACT domain-containing protein
LGGFTVFRNLSFLLFGQRRVNYSTGKRATTLFEFNDMATHLPAGLHLHHIHDSQGTLAALLDQLAECIQ